MHLNIMMPYFCYKGHPLNFWSHLFPCLVLLEDKNSVSTCPYTSPYRIDTLLAVRPSIFSDITVSAIERLWLLDVDILGYSLMEEFVV